MKHTRWVLLILLFVVIAASALLLLQTKADNRYILFPQKTATTPSPLPMHVYVDNVYGFSISYPNDWTYRAYEAGSGVGFRPKNKPNDPQYEYISMSVSPKMGNLVDLPFEEYVKVAAINEIQNYKSLASIKEFKTNDGQVGYITTWMVQPLTGGGLTQSSPIAYLPSLQKDKTIEAFLSDTQYMAIFTTMLSTFQNK